MRDATEWEKEECERAGDPGKGSVGKSGMRRRVYGRAATTPAPLVPALLLLTHEVCAVHTACARSKALTLCEWGASWPVTGPLSASVRLTAFERITAPHTHAVLVDYAINRDRIGQSALGLQRTDDCDHRL
eukprot:6214652-Pleurochrysis_carterae.AAC.1